MNTQIFVFEIKSFLLLTECKECKAYIYVKNIRNFFFIEKSLLNDLQIYIFIYKGIYMDAHYAHGEKA